MATVYPNNLSDTIIKVRIAHSPVDIKVHKTAFTNYSSGNCPSLSDFTHETVALNQKQNKLDRLYLWMPVNIFIFTIGNHFIF
ncbi:hypothetical protein D2V08_12980 [Flagellimonas lutimaris]|uniref:Uncharacterized protein n=1 Tax=Flagellimonas lutimaris TaxID=475082 RepID=A0A3A1N788_9FLAO|nr:hypothetical protein D2V08_12980 [Allomuricauda lutimaris]